MDKITIFNNFLDTRYSTGDWEHFLSQDKSRILRTKILEYCGFSRSILYQNHEIKVRLLEAETDLLHRGILRTSLATSNEVYKGETSRQIDNGENSRLSNLSSRLKILEQTLYETELEFSATKNLVEQYSLPEED